MTYTFKIVYDTFPENPFEARDCLPMLYTEFYWSSNEFQWFDFIKLCIDKLNKRNAYSVLELLWWTKEESKTEIKDRWYIDCVEFAIEKLRSESPDIIKMQEILKLLWYNAYFHKSRGYSQWDYAECLLVSLDKNSNFKDDCKLYDNRARWDVYGYQVIEHKPLYNSDWSLSIITDDALVDSCYWIYWEDWINEIYEQVKSYWITHEQFEDAKQNIEY